jgi:hypothetical protein
MASFSDLVGKTLIKINKDDNCIVFHCETGEVYEMYHEQDCCENVFLHEVHGDLNDLIGHPIIVAEKVSNVDLPPVANDESYTWTFFKIRNINGDVTLRWFGSSNGWYSEDVDFVKISNN